MMPPLAYFCMGFVACLIINGAFVNAD